MFKYKEFAKEIATRFKTIDLEKDEEGRVVLDFNVRESNSLLSPISVGDKVMISLSLGEAILSYAKMFKPKTKVHLKFEGKGISEEEKNDLPLAIANYFQVQLLALKLSKRRTILGAIILSIMAVIFLTLMAIFMVLDFNAILVEIIDIAGWVFMWEAVDQFFIELSLLNIKEKRIVNILGAPVTISESTR